MGREKIEKIIQQLENIKLRPIMYFGRLDDFKAVVHFFHGYSVGLCIDENELLPKLDDYHKIHIKRGWKISPLGVVPQMQEKEMTGEAIVQELIAIEIEAWKSLVESREQK